MIHSVPAEHFHVVFPDLRKWFDSFVERAQGGVTMNSLVGEILNGLKQVYVITVDDELRGCFLTEVAPNGDISLTHCSGFGSDDWGDEVLTFCEAWAADRGVGLVAYCRPGWVRKLNMKGRGYRETHRVMELR